MATSLQAPLSAPLSHASSVKRCVDTSLLRGDRPLDKSKLVEVDRTGICEQAHLVQLSGLEAKNGKPPFTNLANIYETSKNIEPKKISKWSSIARQAQGNNDVIPLFEFPRSVQQLRTQP